MIDAPKPHGHAVRRGDGEGSNDGRTLAEEGSRAVDPPAASGEAGEPSPASPGKPRSTAGARRSRAGSAAPRAEPSHTLHVIDREGRPVGRIRARIGLRTWAGPICRMTDKTIWTRRPDGSEWMFRDCDGPLPSVPRSHAR